MKLKSGREVPDSVLDEVIDNIVVMYASFEFEDFRGAGGLTVQSLQEDDWEGIEGQLTYEEAEEVWDTVRVAARMFAHELAAEYGRLREKYIGTKSWETYH